MVLLRVKKFKKKKDEILKFSQPKRRQTNDGK